MTGTRTKRSSKKPLGHTKYSGQKKGKVDSQTLDEQECRIIETAQARIDRLRKKRKKPAEKACFIRPRVQKNTWRTFKNISLRTKLATTS